MGDGRKHSLGVNIAVKKQMSLNKENQSNKAFKYKNHLEDGMTQLERNLTADIVRIQC